MGKLEDRVKALEEFIFDPIPEKARKQIEEDVEFWRSLHYNWEEYFASIPNRGIQSLYQVYPAGRLYARRLFLIE